jgi:hypothetical protein
MDWFKDNCFLTTYPQYCILSVQTRTRTKLYKRSRLYLRTNLTTPRSTAAKAFPRMALKRAV